MQLMTQAEYARHRGVGAPAVSNWKKAELLVWAEDPGRTGKLLINVGLTDARLASRLDPMRGRPATAVPAAAPSEMGEFALASPGGRSVAAVRGELLEEQIVGQRLKNAEAARELVARVEADRRCGEVGRMARERMHAMFRSMAERLAAETDVRQIMTIGENEIDRVFAGMSFEIEGGALDEVEDEAEPVEAAIAAAA